MTQDENADIPMVFTRTNCPVHGQDYPFMEYDDEDGLVFRICLLCLVEKTGVDVLEGRMYTK